MPVAGLRASAPAEGGLRECPRQIVARLEEPPRSSRTEMEGDRRQRREEARVVEDADGLVPANVRPEGDELADRHVEAGSDVDSAAAVLAVRGRTEELGVVPGALIPAA